jgi:hypothetical protein
MVEWTGLGRLLVALRWEGSLSAMSPFLGMPAKSEKFARRLLVFKVALTKSEPQERRERMRNGEPRNRAVCSGQTLSGGRSMERIPKDLGSRSPVWKFRSPKGNNPIARVAVCSSS